MTPDVSPSCDVGAHERCAGCACGCHTKTTGPSDAPLGPVIMPFSHDRRIVLQAVSAAIPGVTVLALLVWCINLASQGLL